MKLPILALCCSLITSSAWAGACGDIAGENCLSTYSTASEHYDDSDLGKAMAICSRHDLMAILNISPPSHSYAPEWKACEKVRSQWEKTEDARRQREAIEREKRDKAFVEKIAGEAK